MFRWLALAAFTLLSIPAAAADLSPDQKSAICGSRASCKVTLSDAGQGKQQEALTVVEARFALTDKSKDAPDEGCVNDSGDADAPDHDGGHEFWLIAGSAAPKLLLALCNDGYGAAGMGEDDIKVTPNMITWEQAGGSNWRWDVTKEIRLSPLAVVHEMSCTYNTLGPETAQIMEINNREMWARSVGYVAGWHPKNDDETGDCPDWPNGPDATLPTGPDLAGGTAIPEPNAGQGSDGQGVPLPEGTALGDCALPLTTDGLHGFLVFGKAADAASSATIRAAKDTERSLLVQVYDPTAAAELSSGKAKNWIGQPHIEIWTDEPGDNGDPDAKPFMAYRQFAVGLDDKTYPGVGYGAKDTLPAVTHWAAKDEQGRDVTLYRIVWSEDTDPPAFGLGVVYSQAQGGKQARLVSNAQIKKNKPLYLPESWAMAPEDSGIPTAGCSINASKILTANKLD